MGIKKKYNKRRINSSLLKSLDSTTIETDKYVELSLDDNSLDSDSAEVAITEKTEIQKNSFIDSIATKLNDFRGKTKNIITQDIHNDFDDIVSNKVKRKITKEENSVNSYNSKLSQSLINTDVVLKGDLETTSSLEISGKVIGNIQSSEDITLNGDAYIEGNISAKSLYLNGGTIIGDIIVSGSLIVAEKSIIKGSITAETLKSTGAIEGNITVKDNFSLASTGSVLGDVTSDSINIETGAILNGRYFTSTNKSTVLEDHTS